MSCYPKSYSHTVSTINVIGTAKSPLNDFYVRKLEIEALVDQLTINFLQKIEVKIFYKYGTIYREVIHTPRVEWCPVMKDYVQPKLINTPLNMMLLMINSSFPTLLHECPYKVCISEFQLTKLFRKHPNTK